MVKTNTKTNASSQPPLPRSLSFSRFISLPATLSINIPPPPPPALVCMPPATRHMSHVQHLVRPAPISRSTPSPKPPASPAAPHMHASTTRFTRSPTSLNKPRILGNEQQHSVESRVTRKPRDHKKHKLSHKLSTITISLNLLQHSYCV